METGPSPSLQPADQTHSRVQRPPAGSSCLQDLQSQTSQPHSHARRLPNTAAPHTRGSSLWGLDWRGSGQESTSSAEAGAGGCTTPPGATQVCSFPSATPARDRHQPEPSGRGRGHQRTREKEGEAPATRTVALGSCGWFFNFLEIRNNYVTDTVMKVSDDSRRLTNRSPAGRQRPRIPALRAGCPCAHDPDAGLLTPHTCCVCRPCATWTW